MKDRNWYFISDCLLIVSFVCLLLYHFKSSFWFVLIGCVAVVLFPIIIFLLYAFQIGDTVVENNSDMELVALGENNEHKRILPHSVVKGVDGVRINGDVYKFNTGMHVTIRESGKVFIRSIFVGWIIYRIAGDKKSVPPDDKWDFLFEE